MERWEEAERDGEWRRVSAASDPENPGPLFSVALAEGGGRGGLVAAGGGTGRAVSLYSLDGGALLASLPGHTGWVRAAAFHEGQLFTVGCNFVKVWRAGARADAWAHVGDLEVHGDILALCLAGQRRLNKGGAGDVFFLHRCRSTDLLGRETALGIPIAARHLSPSPSPNLLVMPKQGARWWLRA